jgi:hypothetical protein
MQDISCAGGSIATLVDVHKHALVKLTTVESLDFMTRGNREGRFALKHNGKKICNMQTPSLHFFRMSAAMVRFAVCDSKVCNMARLQCELAVSMSSQPPTCRSTALAASSAHERSREAAHVD